jgi:hypothetical protein
MNGMTGGRRAGLGPIHCFRVGVFTATLFTSCLIALPARADLGDLTDTLTEPIAPLVEELPALEPVFETGQEFFEVITEFVACRLGCRRLDRWQRRRL